MTLCISCHQEPALSWSSSGRCITCLNEAADTILSVRTVIDFYGVIEEGT